MASLHDAATMQAYATACQAIWTGWTQPPDTGTTPLAKSLGNAGRKMARQVAFRTAIQNLAAAVPMPAPNVKYVVSPGSHGAFVWADWDLEVDTAPLANDDITYKTFVELCKTCYHETRHAEQFYRVAQGLAAGTIHMPDKSQAQVVQASASGGVLAKVQAFNTLASAPANQAVLPNNAQQRVNIIADWLDIPHTVALHADGASAGFAAFAAAGVPAWFKRATITKEVEDWMRTTYKKTLGDISKWAQSDDGPYKMYRDQADEHDAHEIEAVVKTHLTNQIGNNYAANKAVARSHTATFGP